MIHRIVQLLQQRRPNANQDWHQKLPQMAKRLEDALYNNANSYEEYNDIQTLKGRLQQLALSMGGKSSQTAKGKSSQDAPSSPTVSSQFQPTPHGAPVLSLQGHTLELPVSQIQQLPVPLQPQQQHPHLGNANQYAMMPNGTMANGGVAIEAHMNSTTAAPTVTAPTDSRHSVRSSSDLTLGSGFQQHVSNIQQPRQFINMSQINPLMAGNPPASVPVGSADNLDLSSPLMDDQALTVGGIGLAGAVSNSKRPGPPQPGQTQHTEEHRRQVLKQQQQRLLLLRHASKCPHDNGRCPVTPHCAGMKQLWKHIMSCKDQECKIAHCVSSRYVLSHYSKCKDQNCPVCGPVREAIRRNYDRSRQVLSMSKNQAQSQPATASAPTSQQGTTIQPTGVKAEGVPEVVTAPSNVPAVSKKREKAEPTSSVSGASSAAAAPIAPVSQPPPPPQPAAAQPRPKATSLDPVSCALYSFTSDEIREHSKNIHEGQIMTASQVKQICLPMVDEFLNRSYGYFFAVPVDPVALNIPDYPDIIKNPMDLGTIRKKLDTCGFRSMDEFASDMNLTFDNAMLYNPSHLEVHKYAKQSKKDFEVTYKQKVQQIERETEEKKKNLDACLLCGETLVKFEPPVYYCNGKCNGQRIRRNSFFYSSPNNAYHWCNPCFNDMKDNQSIIVGDAPITKKDLVRKKHSEESEEPWVQCDLCQRWVHQICTLFNGRRNVSDAVAFVCPTCICNQRLKKGERSLLSPKKSQAADLPHCKLTEYIEKRVYLRLEEAYKDRLDTHGSSVDQGKCPPIYIRQVSSVDKAQMVREGVFERYKHKSYPAEFPCRTKCVILFQNIDGQDVILFGMYVYEYGHKCPQPNQRRVYVSYLDSVHFFRPRYYRTMVYHEILIAYLEYVKMRGFHTAHIWACPPLRGDDYILYCHPQDQKTPKDDRLRHWYADMLNICVKRGIVLQVSDLYTEFLSNPTYDATVLPYFEGDYWVNEAEVIIRGLGSKAYVEEVEDDVDMTNVPGTNKRKLTSKNKRTRASRGGAPLSKSERDPVMSKLASIIEPMKEAFFVAKLLPDEFARQCASLREKEVEAEAAAADPEQEKTKARLLQEEALVSDTGNMSAEIPNSKKYENEDGEREIAEEINDFDEAIKKMEQDLEQRDTGSAVDSVSVETAAEGANGGSSSRPASGVSVKAEKGSRKSADAGEAEAKQTDGVLQQAKKKELRGPEEPSTSSTFSGFKDETEDVDDTQESEHFDTRQSFLNLCQGNHYQFDQLRRAKYSSMMVLYHLHNPDAPKFIANCSMCHREILTGSRHHCEICDLDICGDCVTANGPKPHVHPLQVVVVVSASTVPQLTEQQRAERNRSIKLHLELLVHASNCSLQECTRNCRKMKEFVKHESTCQVTIKKGCHACKRIYNLLTHHARSCRNDNCSVLKCQELKDHFRQMRIQQQQMDDRRRAMMNEVYSRGNSSSSATETPA